jgi:hypothetical protein
MKKSILVLSLAALIVASCGSNNSDSQKAESDSKSQEIIDKLKAFEKEAKEAVDETQAVDYNSTPEKVVETIQNAVKAEDLSSLVNLCNENVKATVDVTSLCDLATNDKNKAPFIEYFSTLKVEGVPNITGDKAEVKVLLGKDGTVKKTIKMLKLDSKWYMESF